MTRIRGWAIVAAVLTAMALASPATGSPEVERTQQMTQKDAKFYIARDMKQYAGRYWRLGHDKKIYNCKNLSPIRVRCMVSWYYKEKAHIHGSGTAFYKPNDPDHVYLRRNIKVDSI